MKKCYNLFLVFLIILLIYPVMLFGQLLFKHIGIFFIGLEKLTNDYQHIFQALTSLGIFGILFSWWRWKKEEQENIARNLSSISVDVDSNAIAEVKNTSSVSGSRLFIKIYRPFNFEKADKNKEFLKYVAVDKEDFLKIKKSLFEYNEINWNAEPSLIAALSIGEVAKFHLKNIQEELFVHFAPIKIIISSDKSFRDSKEKYMLFRFSHSRLRDIPDDDFIKDEMHPYGSWVLIYSE